MTHMRDPLAGHTREQQQEIMAEARRLEAENPGQRVSGIPPASDGSGGGEFGEFALDNQGEESSGPSYWGVPDVIVGPDGSERPFSVVRRLDLPGGVTEGDNVVEIAPQYYTGSEFDIVRGMPPSTIRSIQERMVRAGLINENEFIPGVWDHNIADTFGSMVLSYANSTGSTWSGALDQLTILFDRISEDDKEEMGRVLSKQLKPDYASLAQRVKDYARSQIRRELTPHETKRLANDLSADYDALLAQQRQHELEAIALQDAAEETGEDQTPATDTAIDPLSRFQESFDEAFADTREFEGAQEVADSRLSGLFSALGFHNAGGSL